MKTTKKKVIKDLSFDHDNGHVALVGPAVGGPANGLDFAITLKSEQGFSDEILEKASKVQVTLPIEEFLSKFFGLYYEDAEILARTLGFSTEMQEREEQVASEPVENYYSNYIEQKVESFIVMKSMRDGAVDALASLEGEQYLKLLQDQAMLEKAFDAVKVIKQSQKAKVKKESSKSVSSDALDNSTNAGVEKKVGQSKPVGIDKQKETTMTDPVKTVVADVEKELVEKSVLVDLQKAMDAQKEELQKALDLVKQFEQEKKEAITKSRKEKLGAAIKNEQHQAALFKGANLLEDADFDNFVKAVTEMQAVADKSDLFKELGATGEVEVKADEDLSDVQKSVRAKLQAKFKK
jgi:hypothetical protein